MSSSCAKHIYYRQIAMTSQQAFNFRITYDTVYNKSTFRNRWSWLRCAVILHNILLLSLTNLDTVPSAQMFIILCRQHWDPDFWLTLQSSNLLTPAVLDPFKNAEIFLVLYIWTLHYPLPFKSCEIMFFTYIFPNNFLLLLPSTLSFPLLFVL